MKKIALDIARPNSVMLMARIADAMVEQMQAEPFYSEPIASRLPEAQPDNRTRQQRRRDEREARKARG